MANTPHDAMVATTVRLASEHGTVTVFGKSTLLVDGPPDTDGRMRLTLRYDSRSLWLWLNKHPSDVYEVDMWAPIPPNHGGDEQRLPWMRATAYRIQFDSNRHDRATSTFLAAGWAEQSRAGEVLRFRQDVTSPTSEESPGGA